MVRLKTFQQFRFDEVGLACLDEKWAITMVDVKILFMGSGCDSFGRVVASNTRSPWFESSQWQKLY